MEPLKINAPGATRNNRNCIPTISSPVSRTETPEISMVSGVLFMP
jgi:hypothetical protein